ncbi:MAG: hypothetical protein AAF196_04845 [Planctomycetota bacterium]
MPDRNFCSGLLAGAAVVAVPCVVLLMDSNDAVDRNAPPVVHAGDGGGVVTVESLQAENARLRTQLARSDGLRRGPVETDATLIIPMESENRDPQVSLSGIGFDRTEILLDVLRQVDVDGTLAERFSENPKDLFRFVMKHLQETERYAEAYDLYRRIHDLGDPSLDPKAGMLRDLGRKLLANGDRARAREALLYGLRGTLAGWEAFGPLLQVSPGDALAYLDSLTVPISGLDERRAFALLALNRDDEAMALLEPLLEAGNLSDSAWNELIKRNPSLAERTLRGLVGKNEGNERAQRAFAQRLEGMLTRSGRNDEVRETLLATLESRPDDRQLMQRLANVDRWEAIAWARERMSVNSDHRLRLNLASWLLAEDRNTEARDILYGVYDERPTDRNVRRQLLRTDPAGAAERFVAASVGSTDDEYLGDLADELWGAGRRDEAYALWRRAHELDSTDSEWLRKIVAVDQGRPPL